MTFKGIMKIQLSVDSSHGDQMGFAYNADRTIQATFDPALVAGRMGATFPESHKNFFYCEVGGDGALTIGKRAPWQHW